MSNVQLTTEEIELLMLIGAIMEFDKENPGNMPDGGISEVVVSNGVMESDIFNEASKSLRSY